MTPVEERHLRADAARNLERIVEAARAVFAEQGLDTSVAEIAARAGVGTATIFRNFPQKDDLIVAVMEHGLRNLAAHARAAAESGEPDAVRRFLTVAAEAHITDKAFFEAAGTAYLGRERMGELLAEIRAAAAQMLERAQAAGHIRKDVTPEDIPLLLAAVAQTGQMLEPVSPGRWRRYLEIVLDGLRPECASQLPRRAPTPAELERAKSCRPR